MAVLGLYGPIIFHSGSTNLCTFETIRKSVSARWGDHPIHMGKPLLEYSGAQLAEVSFKMELISPYTIDPLGTIVALQEIMDFAVPLPLVVGMFPMGRGLSLFVLQNLSHEMKYFWGNGMLMGASVDVELKEYPTTFSISNLMKALGGVFGGQGGGDPAAPGTDVNAGPLASSTTSTENQGFEASEYGSTSPQVMQNQGPETIGTEPQGPTVPAAPQNDPNAEDATAGEF